MIELWIDEVVVETDAERQAAEGVPAVLRVAMRRLGEKLAALPSESAVAREAVVSGLEIEVGSANELLSDRAAERIADQLLAKLLGRVG